MDNLPTREELAERAKGKPSYAQRRAEGLLKILDKRGRFDTTYPYPIQAWQLGSNLTWVALGGEAVVDYSLRLKRELGPTAWVTAYANDVMEYIPSRRVLKEGGYEAEIFSAHLAGATWAPATAGTEIEVIEHRVSDQSGKDISGPAHHAVHIGGGKSQSHVTEDLKLGSGFHTFGVPWAETEYRFFVDGKRTWAATPVSKRPPYIILSSEIQDKSWAGAIPADGYGSLEFSKTKMIVDYVRFYEPKSDPEHSAVVKTKEKRGVNDCLQPAVE